MNKKSNITINNISRAGRTCPTLTEVLPTPHIGMVGFFFLGVGAHVEMREMREAASTKPLTGLVEEHFPNNI